MAVCNLYHNINREELKNQLGVIFSNRSAQVEERSSPKVTFPHAA